MITTESNKKKSKQQNKKWEKMEQLLLENMSANECIITTTHYSTSTYK